MKKILAILTVAFAVVMPVQAQEMIAIPDTLQGWETDWEVGVNGSQASYSNWAQGGVNTISGVGYSVFTTIYKERRFGYGFRLNTRYGKTRIADEGVRKVDDRLSIRNRFLYDLDEHEGDWKLFGNLNFRTQFDKGYDYGAGEDDGDLLISRFLAPGYLNHNVGIAYIPTENFFAEAGIGGQHTFVRDTDLSETYGLDEGDTYRFEAGLTFASGYEVNIATDILYQTSLETFWSFDKPIGSTDIFFSNRITGQINRLINATLQFDLVYDDDFSKEIQVAQILSVGIAFHLL